MKKIILHVSTPLLLIISSYALADSNPPSVCNGTLTCKQPVNLDFMKPSFWIAQEGFKAGSTTTCTSGTGETEWNTKQNLSFNNNNITLKMQQFSQPQPSFDNPQQEMNSKNLEVISSKLDALRASIESLNQRLANLEAIARGDEEQSRKRRYY